MTLIKAHIIESVAEQIGFPKSKSSEIVETLLELIKSSLGSGEEVMISGFGKFCVKEKKERVGRNPATGEPMMLAPRKVVIFRWSAKLKKRLNDQT
jgi:integration host factor subunit alpha